MLKKKKKKRKAILVTEKSFPYPTRPTTFDPEPSTEVESQQLGIEIPSTLHITATTLRMPPQNQVTDSQTEDEETPLAQETVGRTKYDILWHWRDKLNVYIVLPFIYIVVISALGQLKLEWSSLIHLGALLVIYFIIFIGGKIH